MKCCSRCRVAKPLEEFHKDKSRPDGRQRTCRVCLNAYNKARDASNPEMARERIMGWHKRNRKKETKRMAVWRKANPDRARLHVRNYQGRRYGKGILPYGTVPRLKVAQNGLCAKCRCCLEKNGYHIDHIIPLSRGGENTPHNVQLLCPTCNISKGYKMPGEAHAKRPARLANATLQNLTT